MITYTERNNMYGFLTGDTSDTNISKGSILMNQYDKVVLAKKPYSFNKGITTGLTVADQQFYTIPNIVRKIDAVSVTVGGRVYNPKPIFDRQAWDNLNFNNAPSSDWPQFFFVYGTNIGFWPTPSTNNRVITYFYEKKAKNLNIADYTTGTVSAVTNGASTVTGSGTTWTVKMIGRYIKITETNAVNTGDDEWYEITAVASTTSLTIKGVYNGASISAGSATYTIGQIAPYPSEYQMIPVHHSCYVYFTSVNPDATRASLHLSQRNELLLAMDQDYSLIVSNPVIFDNNDDWMNPNLFLTR